MAKSKKQEVFDAVFEMLEEKFPDSPIRVWDGKELEIRFESEEVITHVVISFKRL